MLHSAVSHSDGHVRAPRSFCGTLPRGVAAIVSACGHSRMYAHCAGALQSERVSSGGRDG